MSGPTSGQMGQDAGTRFRWMLTGTTTPEIYGWFERAYQSVPGTHGYWRTDDPEEAFRRAQASFPELAEEVER